MANQKHVTVLSKGVRAWNEWRINNPTIKPDLQAVTLWGDLRGIAFNETNLIEADICQVDLRQANLSGALLEQSVMLEVDLSHANLAMANLTLIESISETKMSQANLAGADLSGTIFKKVDFSNTNFCESRMDETVFLGIDFSTAKGLETVKHTGPSNIDIETIYRSKGTIPLEFLRGAGIPDNFLST